MSSTAENWQNGGFGLYIHWPFCQSKCPYCDFNSHVVDHIDQHRWAEAYVSELDRYAAETPGRVLNSVFFGGGTPSLMDPSVVEAALNRVRRNWSLSNDIEITMEANPSSVEATRFQAYKTAGVDRVSLGIQALNDVDLQKLGRLHSVDEAKKALDTAQKTFDRVSFDLIYARQEQTLENWKVELEQALSFGTDHLSLYQLTIEDGTAFGDRFARGGLRGLPGDDLSADMYELTQDICEANGMPAYEVSNHAKPGQESRHNLIYWRGGDYIGIGPGAHGRLTLNGQRFATETPLGPLIWLSNVSNKGNGDLRREILSAEDQTIEHVLMGLRTAEGIRLDRQALPETIGKTAELLVKKGLLQEKDGRFSVAAKHRILLNAILRELLA